MFIKPTEQEEAYFIRLELEEAKKAERQRQNLLETEEQLKLKELHHMWCPKCSMQLVGIDYKGIKIDKCTACDGVWLAAGELEALLLNEKTETKNIYRTLIEHCC